MKRPLILISNDDGIHSEGLQALTSALKKIARVVVIAPDREKSGVSHSLTLQRPLRVDRVKPGIYAVDGTPTDCINLAINKILKEKPALVASGINKGGNLGDDITYSGTVSAAIEGRLLGVPSFAISLVTRNNYRFDIASKIAAEIAKEILTKGLPEDTLLNVNVPNVDEREIKGIKITRQGKRIYSDAVVEKTDPRGRKYYWIAGEEIGFEKRKGTDILAVNNNYISITPLHLDLTNYRSLRQLRYWEGSLNKTIRITKKER
jgi:5'-nucleotidase